VDISKVVTLCKLLESLLLVSKSVDVNADPSKLNPVICSTFVFCYLWSIGGNITDTYWDAFDSFVRRQFEDTPDAKVILSSLSFCLVAGAQCESKTGHHSQEIGNESVPVLLLLL